MATSRTVASTPRLSESSGAVASSPEHDRLMKGVDVGKRICSVEGCADQLHARGWCARHYSVWRRTGDPNTEVTRHYSTPEAAFNARTVRVGECLVWAGSRTDLGYGLISVGGRLEMTHRYAWERANGPIPYGIEVDHSCLNRACCEVGHLRLASRHENMRNRSGAQSTSSTGVRNVRTEGSRFRVIVNREHVGSFGNLTDAREAAAAARRSEFGEFAGRG